MNGHPDKICIVLEWIKYDWYFESSHPPKPDRYLIYREKCGKMHFEQWNGSGWASSNGDCTHWCKPGKPISSEPNRQEEF